MNDDDALEADMHLLAGPLEATLLAAHQALLDRMLAGRLDPASTPPG
jgi:hypothetical protein